MRDIHPNYFDNATIKCTSCNTVFNIGSTKKDLKIEICSNCHTFYTKKDRVISSKSKISQFQNKLKKATESKTLIAKKKKKRQSRIERRKNRNIQAEKKLTLRNILAK